MSELTDIKLFLLDMDGTVNLGFTPIPGAADFLNTVINQGNRFIFLTNNSSRDAFEYVEKMRRLGFPCGDSDVFTSGMAAGLFLKSEKCGKSVYVCGTASLRREIASYGVNVVNEGANADIVLLGYDTELDYKKITEVCRLLDGGAEYFATNVDMVCPIENGRYLPDCGSFADMIENAVHRRPVFLGKPDRTMIDILAKETATPYENIAVVGDRIYTDIRSGVNAGVTTVLVFSGETTREGLDKSEIKPTYALGSVKDITNILNNKA